MRQFLFVILILSLAQFSFAQDALRGPVVAVGTGVEIELVENLSLGTLHAGQSIPFKLVRPLEANGTTLVAANSPVSGKITTANAPKHRKPAVFGFALEPLQLADGTMVRIDFHHPARVNTKAEKRNEKVEDVIYWSDPFFPLSELPFLPLVLFEGPKKAKPSTIRAGERYLVYVTAVETPTATATEPPKP